MDAFGWWLKRMAVGCVVVLLASCTGGGGTSASSPSLPGPRISERSDAPAIQRQEAIIPFTVDEEYEAQTGLALINADKAYARGATGEGVRIAVTDFLWRDPVPAEFDSFEGKMESICPLGETSCSSNSLHGLRVAAVALADRDGAGMHGVAFDASLTFVDVPSVTGRDPITGEPADSDAQIARVIDAARDANPDVINISWGQKQRVTHHARARYEADNPLFVAALRKARPDGVRPIYVAAAGNGGGGNGYLNHDTGRILSVRFVHANIERFREGIRTRRIERVRLGAGNPVIIGGLPYLFPELKDHWIVVVAVHNEGSIAHFSDRCGVAKDFCLAAPGGDIYAPGRTGGGTENPNQPHYWEVTGGTSLAAPHVSGAAALLIQLFRDQMTRAEIVTRLLETANDEGIYEDEDIYGHGLLDLDAASAPVGTPTIVAGAHLRARSFSYAESRMLPATAFGDALTRFASGRELALFDALNAPFFVPLQSIVSAPVSDGLAQRFATLRRGGEVKTPGAGFAWGGKNMFASVHTHLTEGGISAALEGGAWRAGLFADTAEDDDARVYGGVIGLTPLYGVSLELGALVETQAFLNAEGSGAFAPHDDSRTIFASLAGTKTLGAGWALNARVHAGLSDTGAVGDALFAPDGRVLTSAFDASVEKRSVFAEGDTFGFHISQPLRVENGSARFVYPTGRTPAGAVLQASERVSLEPSGRRIDMKVAYTYGAWQGRLGVSRHPGHTRSVSEAFSASIVFSEKF